MPRYMYRGGRGVRMTTVLRLGRPGRWSYTCALAFFIPPPLAGTGAGESMSLPSPVPTNMLRSLFRFTGLSTSAKPLSDASGRRRCPCPCSRRRTGPGAMRSQPPSGSADKSTVPGLPARTVADHGLFSSYRSARSPVSPDKLSDLALGEYRERGTVLFLSGRAGGYCRRGRSRSIVPFRTVFPFSPDKLSDLALGECRERGTVFFLSGRAGRYCRRGRRSIVPFRTVFPFSPDKFSDLALGECRERGTVLFLSGRAGEYCRRSRSRSIVPFRTVLPFPPDKLSDLALGECRERGTVFFLSGRAGRYCRRGRRSIVPFRTVFPFSPDKFSDLALGECRERGTVFFLSGRAGKILPQGPFPFHRTVPHGAPIFPRQSLRFGLRRVSGTGSRALSFRAAGRLRFRPLTPYRPARRRRSPRRIPHLPPRVAGGNGTPCRTGFDRSIFCLLFREMRGARRHREGGRSGYPGPSHFPFTNFLYKRRVRACENGDIQFSCRFSEHRHAYF